MPHGNALGRVLVVDDDPDARQLMKSVLEIEGYRVVEACSGGEALELAAVEPVDVVLLDVIMPGMGGLDCCRLLKSMFAETLVPVVLVTARDDVDSKVDGLRRGADDYVGKPYDPRELVARVHSAIRVKQQHDAVRAAKERLEAVASHDELTGLYNYRYLQSRLTEEFARAERYREPLGCVMVDVDHFKSFNDRYGHDVGDAVLAEVAQRMRDSVREVDVVARYGGEEFLMVLPSTPYEGAVVVAERVCRSVRALKVPHGGKEYGVTVSAGVAIYPSDKVSTRDELLKAADRALYQAKGQGRDRVSVAPGVQGRDRDSVAPGTEDP